MSEDGSIVSQLTEGTKTSMPLLSPMTPLEAGLASGGVRSGRNVVRAPLAPAPMLGEESDEDEEETDEDSLNNEPDSRVTGPSIASRSRETNETAKHSNISSITNYSKNYMQEPDFDGNYSMQSYNTSQTPTDRHMNHKGSTGTPDHLLDDDPEGGYGTEDESPVVERSVQRRTSLKLKRAMSSNRMFGTGGKRRHSRRASLSEFLESQGDGAIREKSKRRASTGFVVIDTSNMQPFVDRSNGVLESEGPLGDESKGDESKIGAPDPVPSASYDTDERESVRPSATIHLEDSNVEAAEEEDESEVESSAFLEKTPRKGESVHSSELATSDEVVDDEDTLSKEAGDNEDDEDEETVVDENGRDSTVAGTDGEDEDDEETVVDETAGVRSVVNNTYGDEDGDEEDSSVDESTLHATDHESNFVTDDGNSVAESTLNDDDDETDVAALEAALVDDDSTEVGDVDDVFVPPLALKTAVGSSAEDDTWNAGDKGESGDDDTWHAGGDDLKEQHSETIVQSEPSETIVQSDPSETVVQSDPSEDSTVAEDSNDSNVVERAKGGVETSVDKESSVDSVDGSEFPKDLENLATEGTPPPGTVKQTLEKVEDSVTLIEPEKPDSSALESSVPVDSNDDFVVPARQEGEQQSRVKRRPGRRPGGGAAAAGPPSRGISRMNTSDSTDLARMQRRNTRRAGRRPSTGGRKEGALMAGGSKKPAGSAPEQAPPPSKEPVPDDLQPRVAFEQPPDPMQPSVSDGRMRAPTRRGSAGGGSNHDPFEVKPSSSFTRPSPMTRSRLTRSDSAESILRRSVQAGKVERVAPPSRGTARKTSGDSAIGGFQPVLEGGTTSFGSATPDRDDSDEAEMKPRRGPKRRGLVRQATGDSMDLNAMLPQKRAGRKNRRPDRSQPAPEVQILPQELDVRQTEASREAGEQINSVEHRERPRRRPGRRGEESGNADIDDGARPTPNDDDDEARRRRQGPKRRAVDRKATGDSMMLNEMLPQKRAGRRKPQGVTTPTPPHDSAESLHLKPAVPEYAYASGVSQQQRQHMDEEVEQQNRQLRGPKKRGVGRKATGDSMVLNEMLQQTKRAGRRKPQRDDADKPPIELSVRSDPRVAPVANTMQQNSVPVFVRPNEEQDSETEEKKSRPPRRRGVTRQATGDSMELNQMLPPKRGGRKKPQKPGEDPPFVAVHRVDYPPETFQTHERPPETHRDPPFDDLQRSEPPMARRGVPARRGVVRQATGDSMDLNQMLPPKRGGRKRPPTQQVQSPETPTPVAIPLATSPEPVDRSEEEQEIPKRKRGIRRQATGDSMILNQMLPQKRAGRRKPQTDRDIVQPMNEQHEEKEEMIPPQEPPKRRGGRRRPLPQDAVDTDAVQPTDEPQEEEEEELPPPQEPPKRRGGRRRQPPQDTVVSEDSPTPNEVGSRDDHEPQNEVRKPVRRGVRRQATGDSMILNEMLPPKRAGRRKPQGTNPQQQEVSHDTPVEKTPNEDLYEEKQPRPPRRGITRKATGDSMVLNEMLPPKRGGRRKTRQESVEGAQSDEEDEAPKPRRRFVQRKATGDSMVLNEMIPPKRGGRRKPLQDEAQQKSVISTTEPETTQDEDEPIRPRKRGVERKATGDSMALNQMRQPRKGGRRRVHPENTAVSEEDGISGNANDYRVVACPPTPPVPSSRMSRRSPSTEDATDDIVNPSENSAPQNFATPPVAYDTDDENGDESDNIDANNPAAVAGASYGFSSPKVKTKRGLVVAQIPNDITPLDGIPNFPVSDELVSEEESTIHGFSDRERTLGVANPDRGLLSETDDDSLSTDSDKVDNPEIQKFSENDLVGPESDDDKEDDDDDSDDGIMNRTADDEISSLRQDSTQIDEDGEESEYETDEESGDETEEGDDYPDLEEPDEEEEEFDLTSKTIVLPVLSDEVSDLDMTETNEEGQDDVFDIEDDEPGDDADEYDRESESDDDSVELDEDPIVCGVSAKDHEAMQETGSSEELSPMGNVDHVGEVKNDESALVQESGLSNNLGRVESVEHVEEKNDQAAAEDLVKSPEAFDVVSSAAQMVENAVEGDAKETFLGLVTEEPLQVGDVQIEKDLSKVESKTIGTSILEPEKALDAPTNPAGTRALVAPMETLEKVVTNVTQPDHFSTLENSSDTKYEAVSPLQSQKERAMLVSSGVNQSPGLNHENLQASPISTTANHIDTQHQHELESGALQGSWGDKQPLSAPPLTPDAGRSNRVAPGVYEDPGVHQYGTVGDSRKENSDGSTDPDTDFQGKLYSESAALQEFDRFKQRPKRRESIERTYFNMEELFSNKEKEPVPVFAPAANCSNASDYLVRVFVARLRNGITVLKHNRSLWSKSQLRDLVLLKDGKTLSWKPVDGEVDRGKRPQLDLTKCTEVRHAWTRDPDTRKQLGTSILRKRCKDESMAGRSFALIFAKRTLDVTAVSSDSCKMLVEGFSALCFRLQLEKLHESAADLTESRSIGVEEDWASTVYGDSAASMVHTNALSNEGGINGMAPWGL